MSALNRLAPPKRQGLLLRCLLCVLLWGSGCTDAATPANDGSMTAPATSACVIRFGAALSLSGKTAQEGEWIRDGYTLAAAQINDKGGIRVDEQTCRVHLELVDDGADPQRSALLVEQLIQERQVNLLLGGYGTDVIFAASAVAEKYQIPMVEAGGSGIKIFARGYRYIFGLLPPAPNFLHPVIDLAVTTDPTVQTIALLVEEDGFAQEVANGAAAYAQEKGLSVVLRATYAPKSTDVAALMAQTKALQPDLVLGAGHLSDSILLVKTARKVGLATRLFAFSVGPTSRQFRQALGVDAHYIVGVGPWTEAMKFVGDDHFGTPLAFAQKVRATYDPETYATVPYQTAAAAAALETYRQAIEAAGTYEDPQAVRDALAALNFNSFYGPIAFSPEGIILRPMAVVQIGPDDLLYTVYPADARTGQLLYPMVNPPANP